MKHIVMDMDTFVGKQTKHIKINVIHEFGYRCVFAIIYMVQIQQHINS